MGDKVIGAEDSVIPMQKTSMTTYVAVGVGVLAIGGIVAVTSMGRADAEAEKKAAEIAAQANKKDTTKMTAKERREHMKMTALAFQKAEEAQAAKKAEAARKKAAEEEAEARAKVAAAAPRGGGDAPAAPREPAPKPVNKKAAKKQMDGLDSIGSDIASALK